MAEHVHEWEFVVPYWKGADKVFIVCRENKCKMVMTKTMAAEHLTEYETLKKATERLSAEDAREISGDYTDPPRSTTFGYVQYRKLKAYADILERT